MLRVVGRSLGLRYTSFRMLSSEKPKPPKKTKEEIMKEKTPKGKLEDDKPYEDPYLPRHPGGVNPITGEVNLPPAALSKLRQLSLISLAANSTSNRQIPYAEAMQYLRLNSVRELEDVVIDAIYNKFIKARLDSKGQFIEIDDWASRDTPINTIPTIIATLSDFARRVEDVRNNAVEDANRRDAQVVADRKRVQQAEAELAAARKALDESVMATMNSHEPTTSTRSKPSRSARQRPSQATPASK
ncbi:unnamed protein product [Haemonchus placei]|uniref:PCI domain-containing protein n=1 Tax=Haemonchus placei TaxID=6290 RepID=A0A0N4X6X4_HAEPC|nr:unnamed protein product [Haemonchus placei]